MDKWPAERSQSFVFIGECHDRLGEEALAVSNWQQAYNLEAGRREPFIRLMQFYAYRNDHRRVVAYGEAALTIPQSNFYADNASYYREYPHELLYGAYYWLGDKVKAKYHYDKAFEYCPSNPKYIEDAKFFYAT
jgi:tetratricopeptide (TPR) repeat protein